MAENGRILTTGEFSQKTGIAVSTITQMLRQGKIRGEKRGGKWAIFENELQHPAVLSRKDRVQMSSGPGPIFDSPATSARSYDVETFARMTYLTEKGVVQWLRTGRLSGSFGAGGKILVDAANLDRPELQHIVRK